MILVTMNLFIGNKLVLLFNLLMFVLLLSRLESSQIRCMERERQALLLFKEGLKDDHDILSSWRTDDCCEWMGVKCSNYTSHVIALDLNQEQHGYPPLIQGTIGPSLLELQHLVYLDLSFVGFSGSTIPKFIGSLNKLKHLNLTYTSFAGVIPDQFRNLSNLQSLDLSYNYDLSVRNLEWLSQLSSLRHLALTDVNLSKAYDWSEAIRRLPFLTELQLSLCLLPITATTSFPLFNSSSMSLSIVDLSYNFIGIELSRYRRLFNCSSLVRVDLANNELFGRIPEDFGQMKSLEYLDLSDNKLEGEITNSIGNLSSLRWLDLSINGLNGTIPPSFGKLPKLQHIDLSFNRFHGEIPDFLPSLRLIVLRLRNNELNGTTPPSIGSLSELEELDLSSNYFEGLVSEVHLRNLSKLKILDIANNSLVLKFNSDWVLPTNLSFISLANCKIGPHFPSWLQSQKFIEHIDISVNSISDTTPDWFWDLSAEFTYLNMSHNCIHGILPDLSLKLGKCENLDLRSNNFEGPIPLLPPNVLFLCLSRNRFLGSPSSLCNTSGLLSHVDLSNNLLSGRLPDCWGKFKKLSLLNIANNNISGSIPPSIGQLHQIQLLHLRNNSLEGELPSSLRQCTNLSTIDLGNNVLTGKIPMWLGKSFRNLVVLSLGSNRFYGSIPPQICQLTKIQILDLSQNSISGSIPKCIIKFNVMARKGSSNPTINFSYVVKGEQVAWESNYVVSALLMWKGRELEYGNTLGLMKSIDLSSNELTGEIPSEITYLEGLVSLNLSRNNLNGKIPPEIGHLQLLEFLDLSRNHLSGMIPVGLSQLNFVGFLDLSNNSLSGKIPSSTQLQSFNVSSYSGNHGLCGLPLPNLCSEDNVNFVPGCCQDSTVQKDDKFIDSGFYAAMGFGFVVGLWGTLGSLLLISSWRVAYFRLVANMLDSLYVTLVVNTVKLKWWLKGR